MAHTNLLFLLLLQSLYLLAALWLVKDLSPALQTQRSKSTPFSLLQKQPQSVRGKSLKFLRSPSLTSRQPHHYISPNHHEKPLSNITAEAHTYTHTYKHQCDMDNKVSCFYEKINKQFAFSKIKAWGR